MSQHDERAGAASLCMLAAGGRAGAGARRGEAMACALALDYEFCALGGWRLGGVVGVGEAAEESSGAQHLEGSGGSASAVEFRHCAVHCLLCCWPGIGNRTACHHF